MIGFVKSDSMKIAVLKEQESQLSSKERLQKEIGEPDVLAFDIFEEDTLIGFAALRKFAEGRFFLWNYAIDSRYQNQHCGTKALKELICLLQTQWKMQVMTTTYICGNEKARHVYEKIGFVETDRVNEPGCHEVNMIYVCESEVRNGAHGNSDRKYNLSM
ncbi:GNAT family protein [Roseburia hominis]